MRLLCLLGISDAILMWNLEPTVTDRREVMWNVECGISRTSCDEEFSN